MRKEFPFLGGKEIEYTPQKRQALAGDCSWLAERHIIRAQVKGRSAKSPGDQRLQTSRSLTPGSRGAGQSTRGLRVSLLRAWRSNQRPLARLGLEGGVYPFTLASGSWLAAFPHVLGLRGPMLSVKGGWFCTEWLGWAGTGSSSGRRLTESHHTATFESIDLRTGTYGRMGMNNENQVQYYT